MKNKSTGTAYLLWFLFGLHYAYLNKWGWQILYWLTLGGFGVWAFFDIFTIPGKVHRYNMENNMMNGGGNNININVNT